MDIKIKSFVGITSVLKNNLKPRTWLKFEKVEINFIFACNILLRVCSDHSLYKKIKPSVFYSFLDIDQLREIMQKVGYILLFTLISVIVYINVLKRPLTF